MHETIKNIEKSEGNVKETLNFSNLNSLYVNSQEKINFSDMNLNINHLNKSNADGMDSNKKFSTLQSESFKSPSALSCDERGFIKNKYKLLLEGFSKQKKITLN